MSLKESIRELTVGSKIDYKSVEMDYNGETVVFKQPAQKVRRDIIEKSTKEDGNIDTVSLQVWTVIYLTYDQEGNRVFSEADYDVFMNQPVGSFVDKFAEKAMSLLGNPDDQDGEDQD